MDKHTDNIVTPLSCLKCGKECLDQRGLTNHKAKCKVDSNYSCKFCQKGFGTTLTLYRHEDKCKAIRSTQIEIERLEQTNQLSIQLEEANKKIDLYKINEELNLNTIQEYSIKNKKQENLIQELNKQIDIIKQDHHSNIKSLELKVNSLEYKHHNDQSLIESYQKEILRLKSKLEEADQIKREDRQIILDLSNKVISAYRR